MRIGNHEFDVNNKTYIMGILNITPDSFSDGGKWNNMDQALYHAQDMMEHGAHIIDIGGESTRPGHIQITEQEEIDRVTPVIEALVQRFDIPISIDTYKANVAEAAVNSGAHLINDIWGCKYDSRMAEVIAKSGAACCLMHNKEEAVYEDFMADVLKETLECAKIALAAGVSREKIILDPGVGFGKTYEGNLEVINRLEEFGQLEYPILLGTSRKSVIGLALDMPPAKRVEGTLATTVMGVMKGCAFVRVHDIEENRRVIQMTEAILGR